MMEKKLAEQLISSAATLSDEAKNNNDTSTAVKGSSAAKDDPMALPLPVPYIIQLLNVNLAQYGKGNHFGASTLSSTAADQSPKCIMMDVASGSLIAAPFYASTNSRSSDTSADSDLSQHTMPAVYALSDEAEYYPSCPSADNDIKHIATPITLHLTPPSATLNLSQPPVAILRVLCQGFVLHTYTFVATRKQLRGFVPVVQISTPNAVVDVE